MFTLLCGGSVDLGAFVLVVMFMCYGVFTGLRLVDLIVGFVCQFVTCVVLMEFGRFCGSFLG